MSSSLLIMLKEKLILKQIDSYYYIIDVNFNIIKNQNYSLKFLFF